MVWKTSLDLRVLCFLFLILCGITASLFYRSQCSAWHKRLLWNSIVFSLCRSHLGVDLLQALESNISWSNLSGSLVGLLSKLAQVSVIMSIMGSLALLKAVQLSRKCLIVSSPFLHNKQVESIAFWLKAARLLWSMYVPVTSFSFVLIRRISLAFPIVCITGCRWP